MPKKLNILLSAYACEPNRGSEPGVGWNWAIEIAKRGHVVKVLTRRNNKPVITKETDLHQNLYFIYYDLPDSLMWLKKVFGVQLYYFLWQIGAYFFVKKQLKQHSFDFIHHITFVAIRKYSFLSFLKIPFYYGPLGGGENCPSYLLKEVSAKNKLKEFVRNSLNGLLKFNILSNLIFANSRKIFTTTAQSTHYINKRFKDKIYTFPAIGINSNQIQTLATKQVRNEIQLLYVGQFIYWKGLQICFDALKIVRDKGVNFKLTLVGKGDEETALKQKIEKLTLTSFVEWINWIPQNELVSIYKKNDLFLFPSLHDSGGMVVLEAMDFGLPVICLDIGGPGVFVNEKVGARISVLNKTYHEVVTDYANAIIELANDEKLLQEKSLNAKQSVINYTWQNTVNQVYTIIENDFKTIHN